ncbi:MAG: hypothetical protein QMD46_12285 [Methanomicrobiales archaeon]|nr:hypothetical protein [Methanomicrobiales archaeon]
MVVTAFPDRNRFYPHVVVAEASDSAERPDLRADLWKHQYAVTLEIHAETNTHLYRIRDQLTGWIESNPRTLELAGFVDTTIGPSISTTWDAGSAVKSWRIRVQGLVYTDPPTSALIRILARAGPAAVFASENPVLGAGEPGRETDTGRIKIGDGSASWNVLPYYGE